jgi:hypothetical protein
MLYIIAVGASSSLLNWIRNIEVRWSVKIYTDMYPSTSLITLLNPKYNFQSVDFPDFRKSQYVIWWSSMHTDKDG